MFFDDIPLGYSEHSGENLALMEFNDSNNDVKISAMIGGHGRNVSHRCAHFFKHEKYNVLVPYFPGYDVETQLHAPLI
jgi:hypothetical protein